MIPMSVILAYFSLTGKAQMPIPSLRISREAERACYQRGPPTCTHAPGGVVWSAQRKWGSDV